MGRPRSFKTKLQYAIVHAKARADYFAATGREHDAPALWWRSRYAALDWVRQEMNAEQLAKRKKGQA